MAGAVEYTDGREVRTPNTITCPEYDIKPSDGMPPALEIWKM